MFKNIIVTLSLFNILFITFASIIYAKFFNMPFTETFVDIIVINIVFNALMARFEKK